MQLLTINCNHLMLIISFLKLVKLMSGKLQCIEYILKFGVAFMHDLTFSL